MRVGCMKIMMQLKYTDAYYRLSPYESTSLISRRPITLQCAAGTRRNAEYLGDTHYGRSMTARGYSNRRHVISGQ